MSTDHRNDGYQQFLDVFVDLFMQAVSKKETRDQERLVHTVAKYVPCNGESSAQVTRLQHLLLQLPPMIARKKVDALLEGLTNSRALANADYTGTGPRVRWRICGKVCYPTAYLWSGSKKRKLEMDLGSRVR